MKPTSTVLLTVIAITITALALFPGAPEGARYFAGAANLVVALLVLLAP